MKKVIITLKDVNLRSTLQSAINQSNQYKVVAENSDYERIHLSFKKTLPDIIIIDLQPATIAAAYKAIWEIRKGYPHCRIMILTERARPNDVFTALKIGASGYLLADRDVQHKIVQHLDDLCNGGAPLSQKVAKIIVESFHLQRSMLTKRESEILQFLAECKTYSEIAEQLIISKETAKSHIKNIYAKLKVKRKYEAIAKGVKNKLVFKAGTTY